MHATGTIQSAHTYGTQGRRTCSTNIFYRSPDHRKLVRSRYRLWLHSTACHTCKPRGHATEGIHSACTYSTQVRWICLTLTATVYRSQDWRKLDWPRWIKKSGQRLKARFRRSAQQSWFTVQLSSWSLRMITVVMRICTFIGSQVRRREVNFVLKCSVWNKIWYCWVQNCTWLFALSADAPGTEQVDLSEPKSCNTSSLALPMANFVDSSNASFSKFNSNSFRNNDCLFSKFVASAINDALSKDCKILTDSTDECLEIKDAWDVWLLAQVCDTLVPLPATKSSTWEALSSGLMSFSSQSGIVQPWTSLWHWTLWNHCCTYTCRDCKTSYRRSNHASNSPILFKSPANFAQ